MASNTKRGNVKKTDKQDSKSELIERIPIEGTPFIAIRHEKEWYLTLGKYRLTEAKKTFREIQKESKDASWFRVMQVIQIMIDNQADIKALTTPKDNNQLTIN